MKKTRWTRRPAAGRRNRRRARRTASSRTRSPKGTSRSSSRTRWRSRRSAEPLRTGRRMRPTRRRPRMLRSRLHLLDDRHGAARSTAITAPSTSWSALNPNATINGVVVDYDSEPVRYFFGRPAGVRRPVQGQEHLRQVRGGCDVDAVSRASLSINSATRAIRDSTRMVARALLDPSAVKR